MSLNAGVLGMGIAIGLQDTFTPAAKRVERGMTSLDAKADKTANSLVKSMAAMQTGMVLKGVGQSITGFFSGALKTSSDFGAQLSKVYAKMGVAGKEHLKTQELIRKEALRLGEMTSFTATQAGEGFEYLAAAGFTATQAIAAMPHVLNAATAMGEDLGATSELLAVNMSQFGLEAKDMERIVDVMTTTVNGSLTDMNKYGDAMKFIAPTARAMGVSLEETAAFAGVMANAGLQGSLGTASLRTSLLALAAPSKKQTEMMKKLGYEVFNAKGEFIGLTKMTEQMQKKTKGFTDKNAMAAIGEIFGAESSGIILSAMQSRIKVMKDGKEVTLQGADAMRYLTEQNIKAAQTGGLAAAAAKAMMDNFKGGMIQFKSTTESTMIKIGVALEEMLSGALKGVTTLVKRIGAFAETKFGKEIVKVAAAFGIFALAIGGVIVALAGLKLAMFALGPFMPILIAITVSFAAIYAIVRLVNEGMKDFDALVASGGDKTKVLTGFWGVMQKIGGVVRGLIELFQNWDGTTSTMSENMHKALKSLGVEQLVANLFTWGVRIGELFNGIWEGLKQTGVAMFEMIGAVVEFIDQLIPFGSIIGKNATALEKWAKWGKYIGYIIGGVLVYVVALLIVKMFALAVAVIAATWPILLIIGVIGLLVYAGYELWNNWSYIIDSIVGAFYWLWEQIKTIGQFLWDYVFFIPRLGHELVMALWDGVAAGWKEFVGWLEKAWDSVLNFLGLGDDGTVKIEGKVTSPTQLRASVDDVAVQRTRGQSATPNTTVNNNISNTPVVSPIYLDGRKVGEQIAEINTRTNELQY